MLPAYDWNDTRPFDGDVNRNKMSAPLDVAAVGSAIAPVLAKFCAEIV